MCAYVALYMYKYLGVYRVTLYVQYICRLDGSVFERTCAMYAIGATPCIVKGRKCLLVSELLFAYNVLDLLD
jgi:hypothetical protein